MAVRHGRSLAFAALIRLRARILRAITFHRQSPCQLQYSCPVQLKPRTLLRLLAAPTLLVAPLFALQQGIPHDDGEMGETLKSLLRVSDPSTGFFVAALGVAFLAGAAHALTPGHGKAIVAAYLAGSRGTVWDAVYLGSVVTVTHTATVFILGLITLYATQHFLMEEIYAWLSVSSGLLIVGIGVWLLRARWRSFRSGDAGHGHSHSHSHGPLGGHTHVHPHDDEAGEPDNHAHEHSHGHHHNHEHAHTHDHPPAAGRGSLLSLGISGGLVPCPEALAVLLISFTINRLVFGLIILVAFSLGLAAVLIAIGVAMVLAGPALGRFAKDGPLMRALPVGSAVIVTTLGLAILYKAASDTGLL